MFATFTRLASASAIALSALIPGASAQSPDGIPDQNGTTIERAWSNNRVTRDEWLRMQAWERFDTIPYKREDAFPWLDETEFRALFDETFVLADTNGNGVLDTQTEVCLMKRSPEGLSAARMGFSLADIPEATVNRMKAIASRRVWNGPHNMNISDLTGVRDDEHRALIGPAPAVYLTWDLLEGCAFMATGGQEPPVPATPVPPVTPVTPVTPATPASCTVPSQADAVKLVLESWKDGLLSKAEADTLNRGRFAQIAGTCDGSFTEAQFVAISLADFDRADRNKDGVLSGRREIGALANPGSPVASGLTRKQAEDLAKLRFAVLDSVQRDGAVTLAEYLARTQIEFGKGDANGDAQLTPQEAARTQSAN